MTVNAPHSYQPELPSPDQIAAMTPMMRQYYELKREAADAILFFRMGDFYEIFGQDSEIVAPILELVLTSRERGDQNRVPFCGVPHHSVHGYLLRLLKKGYKVAIADQVEDPAEAKGLVKRAITRTMTPGCVDELDGLEHDSPNFLMAVYEDANKRQWSILICDISTGEMRLGALESNADIASLVDRYRPKEILARSFFHDDLRHLLASPDGQQVLIQSLPEAALRDEDEQRQVLMDVFGKGDLTSHPCGKVEGGMALVAAVLEHIRSLQASTAGFMTIRPLHDHDAMQLSETAIRDLELFETAQRREARGSLFYQINHTRSPMGARLLRHCLAHPLVDLQQIRRRHASVRALCKLGEAGLENVRSMIKGLPDLERLATRIFSGRASPQELARARTALEQAGWLVDEVIGAKGEKLPGEIFKAVATGLRFSKRPLKILNEALLETPTGLGTGQGVFQPTFDKELAKLNELANSGQAKIDAYRDRLRDETGIASLKIKQHKTFGLLIEITKANLAKVPDSFIRRQTMVNNERFVTPELQDLGEALSQAAADAVAREQALYLEVLKDLCKFKMDISSVAQALASFDMLQSHAWLSLRHSYTEPKLNDDGLLDLQGARHPVVEQFVGLHNFTANDVRLDGKHKHLLITGPNMAGKSTVMRQTALCAILSQAGCFVPASKAKLPVFDGVYTRVGASDDLSRGQSTFMVEMSEAATILRQATPKSLVILDEVGRGTSTQDGLAIASAILEDIVKRVRCFTLFATHYHELVPLAQSLQPVAIMQTQVIEESDSITFTHRLIKGASGSSYGIEVAKLAGLPEPVLELARSYVDQAPDTQTKEDLSAKASASTPPKRAGALAADLKPPLEQRGLDPVSEPKLEQPTVPKSLLVIREKLKRANVNRMTPLQALNMIAELQGTLEISESKPLFRTETL